MDMKREIKFRGKRTDNGEWIYGMPTFDFIYLFNGEQLDSVDNYRIEVETIGQFTGLKDRNGVEIYEGDIISFKWFSYGEYELEHEYKGTVEFWNGSYMFCCEHGNYPFSELDFDSESDIEIIGNIFDNPELLKDK